MKASPIERTTTLAAQAEVAERGCGTPSSLGQANERTSALKRLAAWESL